MTDQQALAFPRREQPADIPPVGVLAATIWDLRVMKAALGGNGRRRTFKPPLARLEIHGDVFVCGPVLGSPMAVMALENLSRRGAREVFFMGLAGALDPALGPGSLFAPDRGLSTEGTSAHYPAPLTPDADMFRRLAARVDLAGGSVWTTDAPYRETFELVAAQRKRGALAVDMECCALMAAAGFLRLKLAAILTVSDVLSAEGHRVALREPAFIAGLKRAAEIVRELLHG